MSKFHVFFFNMCFVSLSKTEIVNMIEENDCIWSRKKSFFQLDNARVHTCVVSMAKPHELGYELILYPPCSPDLTPSDYYLFPNLKKWLGGKRLVSNGKKNWRNIRQSVYNSKETNLKFKMIFYPKTCVLFKKSRTY